MTIQQLTKPAILAATFLFLTVLAGCQEPVTETEVVVRPVKILTIDDTGGGRVLGYAGQIEAGETADVSFEVAGRIIELPVVEGQEVSQGELLGRLDPADFQSRLDQAEADYRAAESVFKRYEELVATGAVSRQDFDLQKRNFEVAQAARETVRKALSDTRLLAPFAGNIGRTYVDSFTNVQAKQAVVLLQDMTTLDVVVTIPEQDWSRARPGQTPEETTERVKPMVSVSTFPGRQFPARLTEISTVADPVTRTFSVRMKIDPPEDVNLLPGMTANVTVTVPGDDDRVTGTQAAMLPSTAVFSDDAGNPSVWVVDAETMQVSRRKVEVADMTGSEIRVLSGLQPGDRVAVSGVNNLREGLQVRELGN